MQHTHYIYEVVLTEEMRMDNMPEDIPQENRGWAHYQLEAVSHFHEIQSDHDDGI